MRKTISIIGVIAVTIAVILISGNTEEWKKQEAADSSAGAQDTAKGLYLPSDAVEGIDVGSRPPDFSLTMTDGTKINLSDYEGRIVYLNFWAAWCGPCVAEMPDMQKIYEQYDDQIVMIAVNAGGEDQETVTKFMEENQYTFPAGIDGDGQISWQYQVTSIPATFVINSAGVISTKKVGLMWEDEMREAVEKAIEETQK